MVTVGIIAPGTMGSAVGAVAVANGNRAVWASQGRSPQSVTRATDDGLTDVSDMGALLATSDMVLSLCPPHAAVQVAEEVASHAYSGVFIDGNAISPTTMEKVATAVSAGGARVVDGSIVGKPPRRAGTTRLFLAGDEADAVAEVFSSDVLEVVRLDAQPPAASALKMAYAAWSKGSTALLLTVRAYAAAANVDDALIAEWSKSKPGLAELSEQNANEVGPKAWRWVAEMEEIASTLGSQNLPEGFHHAAAEVFHRMRGNKDQPPPSIDEVIEELLAPGDGSGADAA